MMGIGVAEDRTRAREETKHVGVETCSIRPGERLGAVVPAGFKYRWTKLQSKWLCLGPLRESRCLNGLTWYSASVLSAAPVALPMQGLLAGVKAEQ